jgi:maleylpyruvate isomerase
VIAPSERPTGNIENVRRATRRLLDTVDDLTDAQAARGSLVPNWTRAEVVTHLARNADSFRGMAEAAAHGHAVAQYPGGRAQRSEDIAKGRDVGAAPLRTDLRRACDALMEVWSRLPDDAWHRPRRVDDDTRTVADTVWSRWREIEIHHLDLDLGYAPSEWPVAFVQRALDERFAMVDATRADAGVPEMRARLEASDLERVWLLDIASGAARVLEVKAATDGESADAVVRAWGCDLLAWLYGRDPRGVELSVSGMPRVVDLPEWFPFE